MVRPPSAQRTYPPASSESRYTGTAPSLRSTSGGSFVRMAGSAVT